MKPSHILGLSSPAGGTDGDELSHYTADHDDADGLGEVIVLAPQREHEAQATQREPGSAGFGYFPEQGRRRQSPD